MSNPQQSLHILERPHLAFPLERGPVHQVNLHELASDLERFLFRFHLDQRVTADDLFRFGERAIGHAQLAAALANSQPVGGALEPRGVLDTPL